MTPPPKTGAAKCQHVTQWLYRRSERCGKPATFRAPCCDGEDIHLCADHAHTQGYYGVTPLEFPYVL